MRPSIFSTLFLAVCFLAGGCAGGGQASAEEPLDSLNSAAGIATAKLHITWPSSREIPVGTNRLVIYVTGPDISGAVTYILDRAASSSSEVGIEIPAGPKRRFSAEARRLEPASTKFATIKRVPYSSPDLKQGVLLGVGRDQHTPDLDPGEHLGNIEIDVQKAADGNGVFTVSLQVNQIQISNDRWPGLIALQIIRDQNGNPITGLNRANFRVFEDGQEALVTDVRTGVEARNDLYVSFVLDRSGSMSNQDNAFLESAASHFVGRMEQEDWGQVINFADSVEVTQDFTRSKSLLLDAINGRSPGGSTALWDAAYQGVLDTGARDGRHAVLTMTDGENNLSSHTLEQVISAAQTLSVPVFSIGLGAANESPLRRLAAETGGQYRYAPSAQDLDAIYDALASQLQAQVQVDFISPDPIKSGRTRSVRVLFTYGAVQGETTYQYVY